MKNSNNYFDKDIKIREEQEFSRFVQDQLRKDRMKQVEIQRLIQQDFIESNAEKRMYNQISKRKDQEVKMQETYSHFPYTGSDEVDRKRHELKLTQRKDFQQYLNISGQMDYAASK